MTKEIYGRKGSLDKRQAHALLKMGIAHESCCMPEQVEITFLYINGCDYFIHDDPPRTIARGDDAWEERYQCTHCAGDDEGRGCTCEEEPDAVR
jgi:hypothetical protein